MFKKLGRYGVFDKFEVVLNPKLLPLEMLKIKNRFGESYIDGWQRAVFRKARWKTIQYFEERNRLNNKEQFPDKLASHNFGDSSLGQYISKSGGDVTRAVDAVIDNIQKLSHPNNLTSMSDDLYKLIFDYLKFSSLHYLHYTGDDGEIPVFSTLAIDSHPGFPTQVLSQCNSALSLFCAAYLGRNDLIFLYDSFIPNVTCVDIDGDSIDALKIIFPPRWKYITQPYMDFIESEIKNGSSYDLVVADPWMGMNREVAWTNFNLLRKLSNKYIICLYTLDMFDELGFNYEDGVEALSTCLSLWLKQDIKCISISKRRPDIFWVCFAS
jgi:hypothetical protein